MEPADGGRVLFDSSDRDVLALYATTGQARVIRKRARAIAVKMDFPFSVVTSQGTMAGEPGDWLVTNHPDDDPGSDIWPVSAERMAATYEDA